MLSQRAFPFARAGLFVGFIVLTMSASLSSSANDYNDEETAALLKVLTENRIAGAAMDVGRAPDQMPSAELARLANVIATPHIGGLTPPASESQAFDTVRQVEALVKGEVPPGAANLKDWTRRG